MMLQINGMEYRCTYFYKFNISRNKRKTAWHAMGCRNGL